MKSIGEHLKDIRVRLGKSKRDLSKATKIKEEFIDDIENEKWNLLPEYPVVVGFVKNISKALRLQEDQVMALLRRDYPPKKINPNPKPDIKEKFAFNPRLTFISGVLVAVLAVLFYVAMQYFNYVAPPKLEIISPKDGQTVNMGMLKVVGTVDSDATLEINNQPVLVADDGNFVAELEVGGETQKLEAVAKSRAGKETRKTINIKVE